MGKLVIDRIISLGRLGIREYENHGENPANVNLEGVIKSRLFLIRSFKPRSHDSLKMIDGGDRKGM
jgi:hypothetical protein